MTTKVSFKNSIIAGLLAGITAAAINAILFLVFHAAGVLSDSVLVKPNQPLTLPPVVMASIVPAIVGSIIFFIIDRFSKNGYRIFTILSIVLVALSLASPFKMPVNVTVAYALVLCLMHVVVAVAVLFFIGRLKRSETTQSLSLS